MHGTLQLSSTGQRSRLRLTILALNLGDAGDVAGAKGKGGPHEAEEDDEPEQERVGLEGGRHGLRLLGVVNRCVACGMCSLVGRAQLREEEEEEEGRNKRKE
jgi:hypothetical protein